VASTQNEIAHLLNFIASTDCVFERNSSLYKHREAVDHIHKKYQYFAGKIKSAEDFINLSATKSSISGKYYKIHCNNQSPINSQAWLLTELKAQRDSP
jgi:hypothetical protein